jgi:hypothetical protein
MPSGKIDDRKDVMIEFYLPTAEKALKYVRNGMDPYSALRELPLSVFGRLMVQPSVEFPAMAEYLPKMPHQDIQTRYNGRANLQLLPSSVAFMESVCYAYTRIYGRQFPVGGKILDYGFGWGRLIRMAYWMTDQDSIYGLDPQQTSIDICNACNVAAHLKRCDEIPTTLPVEDDFFDLAISFSVFTHLSFPAADAVLKALRRHVVDNSLLVITIRPIEFWDHYKAMGRISDAEYDLLRKRHHNDGFAYIPLKKGWGKVDGEVHFGDTSISLEFIRSHWPEWQVAGTNLTLEDPFQVHVFLTPA